MDPAHELIPADTLTAWVLPVMFAILVVEALWSWRTQRGLYEARDFGVSVAMLLGSFLIEIVPKIVIVGWMIQLHEWSPLRDVIVQQWWAWGLLFFLDDFTYYVFHRTNHEVRFLWAGHVNHHSSEYMNFGTALRQGVGERVYKYLFWLWLPALGFDPAMVLLMIAINLTYQFFTHTEAVRKLPRWFEAVFNSPSHHRVHHGSNVRYLDRNHGGILIVWDKLFGTFSPEAEEEPVRYGLTTNLSTRNPWTVFAHEYVGIARDASRAKTWRDRFGVLFQAPGWSPDGPDKRAKTLRAQAAGR